MTQFPVSDVENVIPDVLVEDVASDEVCEVVDKQSSAEVDEPYCLGSPSFVADRDVVKLKAEVAEDESLSHNRALAEESKLGYSFEEMG